MVFAGYTPQNVLEAVFVSNGVMRDGPMMCVLSYWRGWWSLKQIEDLTGDVGSGLGENCMSEWRCR